MAIDETTAAARSPDGTLGYLFRVAYQAFREQLGDALAAHQLSVPQYSALSAFDARSQLSSADLARLLEVTPQFSNTVVHQLLDRDLLSRSPEPPRGRTLTLQLTARGRRLLDQATTAVRQVENAALAGHDPRDQRLIKTWLSDLARQTSAVHTRNVRAQPSR